MRPPGLIPEHPSPASRSTQDSYVSKGGPLGGLGAAFIEAIMPRTKEYLKWPRGQMRHWTSWPQHSIWTRKLWLKRWTF